MTVKEYLLNKAMIDELCLIRVNGFIMQTIYVEWKGTFLSGVPQLFDINQEIKHMSTGAIPVRDRENKVTFVPATFIEVDHV